MHLMFGKQKQQEPSDKSPDKPTLEGLGQSRLLWVMAHCAEHSSLSHWTWSSLLSWSDLSYHKVTLICRGTASGTSKWAELRKHLLPSHKGCDLKQNPGPAIAKGLPTHHVKAPLRLIPISDMGTTSIQLWAQASLLGHVGKGYSKKLLFELKAVT